MRILIDKSYDQHGFFLYDDNYKKLHSSWMCGIDEEEILDSMEYSPISGAILWPVWVSPKIFAELIK